MHAALASAMLAAVIGVDAGWKPAEDGSLEYIIQIEPELIEQLSKGDVIIGLRPEMRNVRQYRIRVGNGPVPRQGAQPKTEPQNRVAPSGTPTVATPPEAEDNFPNFKDAKPATSPPDRNLHKTPDPEQPTKADEPSSEEEPIQPKTSPDAKDQNKSPDSDFPVLPPFKSTPSPAKPAPWKSTESTPEDSPAFVDKPTDTESTPSSPNDSLLVESPTPENSSTESTDANSIDPSSVAPEKINVDSELQLTSGEEEIPPEPKPDTKDSTNDAPAPEEEPKESPVPWIPITLLFISLGGNALLGWTTWDARTRLSNFLNHMRGIEPDEPTSSPESV